MNLFNQMSPIYMALDGIKFKMKEEFDFSFISKYGRVFKVFDDQDSGNICFGVERDSKTYFVKFAGAPTAEYRGDRKDAIERLKNTWSIYEDIKADNLIKFLYAEEIGTGFAMVYEWVDGKCMGRMYPQEHSIIMGLPICEKNHIFDCIVRFMDQVAKSGYVAIDFYDGSILYDPNRKKTTICDIDYFQKQPFINNMGQMWGSSRFMSPEEYQLGAELDEITNVFTLGQMAFSLYTDSNREKTAWPLNENSFYVVQKAISPDRKNRYQTIEEFYRAWVSIM